MGLPPGKSLAISSRELVGAAVARGQLQAALTGRPLSLRWRAPESYLPGDEVELGQAVDNMISNGFDHGEGPVLVEVSEGCGRLYVKVLDSGRVAFSSRIRGRAGRWRRIGGRARHGHGLKVVRRAAKRHGGGFRLRHSRDGTEARLELPLAGGKE